MTGESRFCFLFVGRMGSGPFFSLLGFAKMAANNPKRATMLKIDIKIIVNSQDSGIVVLG
jgi:hypothetical protein